MSKNSKIIFVLFNVVYFGFNWLFIPYLPNFLVFGWMPFQMFALFASPLVAAFVWWLYFNAFFKTQRHVNYEEQQPEV